MLTTIKRIVTVLLLGTSLFLLQSASSDSLWLNQPEDDDILETIETLQQRSADIKRLMEEALETDPDAKYLELFQSDLKHTFTIDFDQDTFDDFLSALDAEYQATNTYQTNQYFPVQVTYHVQERTMVFDNVGFRLTGSVNERRYPLNEQGELQDVHFLLKFNETFNIGVNTETFVRLKTREFAGIEELIFRYNSTEDRSQSIAIFGHQTARNAGVHAPNANYSEIVIRVEDTRQHQSLYTMIEHVDEEFLRRTFDTKDVGNLYEAGYGGTLEAILDPLLVGIDNPSILYNPLYERRTNEEDVDYSDIISFTNDLDVIPQSSLPGFFDTSVDVDHFLRMAAIHVLLGNVDDYRSNGNNIYYYFDEDRLTVIPSDYTNIMGIGFNGVPAFINNTLGNDIYSWGRYPWSTFTIPLWDRIIALEENQITYEEYLLEFSEDLFTTDAFMEQYIVAKSIYGDTYSFQLPDINFITNKQLIIRDQVAYHQQQRTTE